MANYTVEKITDKKIWEDFVLSQQPKSFLQSWAWGETNVKIGAKIIRLGFKKNTTLVGVALLIKEQAKRGPHLLIPGGPIINWQDKDLSKVILTAIKKLALEEKVWFVRIRPEVLSSLKSLSFFRELGFISAPMHLSAENTWILDISRSEEDLLAQMRKSTRYLIKKSLNFGLTLKKSIASNEAKLIYKLQKETIIRHKFVGFSEALFKSEIESFIKDGNIEVFSCRKGNSILAAAIILYYGDSAYYHFSGSTSEYRDVPFSYFLQWQIIKEAKNRGMKYYNFWGISPDTNSNHRFAGVTLFKTGFGGQRVDWLHAHDFPVSPLYWLTFIFETFRRIIRRL